MYSNCPLVVFQWWGSLTPASTQPLGKHREAEVRLRGGPGRRKNGPQMSALVGEVGELYCTSKKGNSRANLLNANVCTMRRTTLICHMFNTSIFGILWPVKQLKTAQRQLSLSLSRAFVFHQGSISNQVVTGCLLLAPVSFGHFSLVRGAAWRWKT